MTFDDALTIALEISQPDFIERYWELKAQLQRKRDTMPHRLLLACAFVLFVVATFAVQGRVNLIAAGLACWVATGLF